MTNAMSLDSSVPHLPGMVETEHMQCRFPSRPDWIEPTVEFLRQRSILCGACDEVRAGRIMIGLHEAISNAIVHGNLEISSALKEQGDETFAHELARRSADEAYGNRIVTVRVDYDGAECRWSITDEGKGFDVEQVLQRDPTSGEQILLSSGRGLLMMKAFFDSVHYEMGGRRVVLMLRRDKHEQQRKSNRLPSQQRVRVVPLQVDGSVNWQAAYEALAHNLSGEGMAVLQAQLATADRILIGLETGGEPLYVPAEVRHFRQVGSDMIELGCHFQPPSKNDPLADSADTAAALLAIAELVDRLEGHRSPDDDRRAHPRVAYTAPIQISGGSDGEPTVGFGRDLSKGGMAFVTTAPIPHQRRLLTLPSLSGPAVRLQAQILRCDRIMDGFYDVGARFEQTE